MMPKPVVDLGSNLEENLERWARSLSGGGAKLKVFRAMYSGKKSRRTPPELAKIIGLTSKRVTEVGKALHHDGLLTQLPVWPVVYEKIPVVHHYKNRVLALLSAKAKLEEIPTKRKHSFQVKVSARAKLAVGRAVEVSVDQVDEFARVRKIKNVPRNLNPSRLPEEKFKLAICALLKEQGEFKDHGGELFDLFTTNLRLSGKRHSSAFALKGPAKTGKLTPGKMGKNGDQIQRLVDSGAQVVFIQYEGQIDQSVHRQLKSLCRDRARSTGEISYYGLIDKVDSYRLRLAYPNCFV
jgi:hypothetical protein